ncbi:MAG: YMGG-like glycine zipper-containing protein [Myxococcales bacterium]|nr:YMGG-like glycine zipper-containing protein [Myxococcales bacterium]MDH5307357.1 YMGG-like glycine zipper-containing protein [Myxococcales bacterium]MDH5565587.1 YMGG-like glycine zipper-containing protein [Myxococcales bacterium]
MTQRIHVFALAFAFALAAPAVLAQEIFIYPAKGQSADQQEKDKFECYQWAKQQTGFDPMQQPNVASAPTQLAPQSGGAARGAARGAAVGAIGGAIAGDAGKGAAVGAGVGAAGGALRKRDARRENEAKQEAAEQQAKQVYGQGRASWESAAKTCLQGRGYSVN